MALGKHQLRWALGSNSKDVIQNSKKECSSFFFILHEKIIWNVVSAKFIIKEFKIIKHRWSGNSVCCICIESIFWNKEEKKWIYVIIAKAKR